MSLALAGQAQALSCLRPDPFAAFDAAAAAEEAYIVVHGRFDFDESRLPGLNGAPMALRVGFEGLGLTRDGFSVPVAREVVLDISCAGAWCGSLTPGRPVLAFLERRADGLHLDLGACPTAVFDLPEPGTLRRLAACLDAPRCAEAP
jgi:ABC-type amino acid transport substrate-binding protein